MVGVKGVLVQLVQFLPFLLELLGNHGVILYHFRVEIVPIPKSLLDFPVEAGLVLDPFTAISHELLGELLDLISLLLQVLDGLAFDLDHLLEVVALDHQLRNGLFVVGLVDPADLDQHVQPLVLQKGERVLVFHLLDLLLDLCNLAFLLFDLLLVLELALVVVLDDLQLLQPLGQNLVLIEIGVHFLSDTLIVLLQLLELLHHLPVHILLDAGKETLLAATQLAGGALLASLSVEGVQQPRVIASLSSDEDRPLALLPSAIDGLHLFGEVVQAQEGMSHEGQLLHPLLLESDWLALVLPIGQLVIHGAIERVEGRLGFLETRRIFSLFQNGLLFLLGLQRDL